PPRPSALFPYTTLFRSVRFVCYIMLIWTSIGRSIGRPFALIQRKIRRFPDRLNWRDVAPCPRMPKGTEQNNKVVIDWTGRVKLKDRKSTRLNSSHVKIS